MYRASLLNSIQFPSYPIEFGSDVCLIEGDFAQIKQPKGENEGKTKYEDSTVLAVHDNPKPSSAVVVEFTCSGTRSRRRLDEDWSPLHICWDGARLFVKGKAPGQVHISGLTLLGKTKPIPHCKTVEFAHNGDWVYLRGCIPQVSPVGHTRLDAKLPTEICPLRDLDFPICHRGRFYLCRIYTDGRVVVDTGLLVQVGENKRSADVDISGIRYSVSEEGLSVNEWGQGKDVSADPLRVFLSDGKALLQGKIGIERSEEEGKILLAVLPVRPVRNLIFFVLNRVRSLEASEQFSRVTIDTSGRMWLWVSISTPKMSTVSVSGIIFHFSQDQERLGELDIFKSSISDNTQLRSLLGEAIEDYVVRRKLGTQVKDMSVLQTRLLDSRLKKVQQNPAELCGWSKQFLGNDTSSSSSVMTDVAVVLGRQAVDAWGLRGVAVKLKKFLDDISPTPGKGVCVVKNARRPLVSSARASFVETMRFGFKKCIYQVRVAKAAELPELEKLNEVMNWWHQWNSHDRALTHSSFMGNQDIFTETGKWVIPDDPAVQDELFRHMAWIYKKGYDTFISEIQTPLFPLIEDLDCESTLHMADTQLIDDMFLSHLGFLKERARALKIIFPASKSLTCYVYSSSGFNKSKGRWKSSFHLVWPELIVDGHLAPIIRQITVEYFLYLSGRLSFFKRMEKRLLNHYDANIWENIFDQTTANANNGLRMPYCNKATWVKTDYGSKKPSVENRHAFPIGAIRFDFPEAQFESEAEKSLARAAAMATVIESEQAVDTTMGDQNTLVGDRTQYKQSDKNTVHRTNAFYAAMRAAGGDSRELMDVHAEWVERVEDPKVLSEEEVAKWIKRGSCRREPKSTFLSDYDRSVVEAFEKADLEFFAGHTLDSLRDTELWKKMTPAAQAGLKTRFRKFQTSSHAADPGAALKKKPPTAHAPVSLVTEPTPVTATIEHDDDEVVPGDFVAPPMDQDDVEDSFDLNYDAPLNSVRKFSGTIAEFRALLDENEQFKHRGAWIHYPLAATWVSDPTAVKNNQVCVSLYYASGKVVVYALNKTDDVFETIRAAVEAITAPDDGLFYNLPIPTDPVHGYPLPDKAQATAQREQYEKKWKFMLDI